MSAWLVSKAHIDVLVTAAHRLDRFNEVPALPTEILTAHPEAFRELVEPRKVAAGEPLVWRPRGIVGASNWLNYENELGRALWLANSASLRHRYNGRADDYWPEIQGNAEMRAYRWKVEGREAVNIIKACHCYAYQCSNVPDWETSWQKKAVSAIESMAVRSLPGYDAAPWGE